MNQKTLTSAILLFLVHYGAVSAIDLPSMNLMFDAFQINAPKTCDTRGNLPCSATVPAKVPQMQLRRALEKQNFSKAGKDLWCQTTYFGIKMHPSNNTNWILTVYPPQNLKIGWTAADSMRYTPQNIDYGGEIGGGAKGKMCR